MADRSYDSLSSKPKGRGLNGQQNMPAWMVPVLVTVIIAAGTLISTMSNESMRRAVDRIEVGQTALREEVARATEAIHARMRVHENKAGHDVMVERQANRRQQVDQEIDKLEQRIEGLR